MKFRKIMAVILSIAVAVTFMPAGAFATGVTEGDSEIILTVDFDGLNTTFTEAGFNDNSNLTRISDLKYKKHTGTGDYEEIHSGVTLESFLRETMNKESEELEAYSNWYLVFTTNDGKTFQNDVNYTIGNLLANRYLFEGGESQLRPVILSLEEGKINMYSGQKDETETNGTYWIKDIKTIRIVNPDSVILDQVDADYTAADISWFGDGSETSYSIDTAAEFLGMAKLVNVEGNSLMGKVINLSGDIDMNGLAWTPIGNSQTPFKGEFNGNGNKIINTSLIRASDYAGLFGYNMGTIKNFTIKGQLTVNGLTDYVGSVAAFNGGTISRVESEMVVEAGKAYNVGGIAGLNASGSYLGKEGASCHSDGAGTIKDCGNRAQITGNQKVGGIAGENAGTIEGCYNTGVIKGTNNTNKNGVGGIAGRNGNNNTAVETGIITGCYNTGAIGIAMQKWTGGITGFQNSKSKVEYCYNIGAVVSNEGYSNSIVGQNEGRATANYSLTGINCTGSSEPETGIMVSEAQLKTEATANALSAGAVSFVIDAAKNNGYPTFAWIGESGTGGSGETGGESGTEPDKPIAINSNFTFKLSSDAYTYTGSIKTPKVTVKDDAGNVLVKDRDYKLTYASGRKKVGIYWIKVIMEGDYSGSKTLKYVINPKGTKLKSLSRYKRAMRVKYYKQSAQISGYQIAYSTNKDFDNGSKYVNVSGASATSKYIRQLSSHKKYYVKVRTYKTVGKTKYYSVWSPVKSVITK